MGRISKEKEIELNLPELIIA